MVTGVQTCALPIYAACAASLERSSSAAAAATSTALARAQTASADCTAATSTADFRAGGSVTVRVSCRVELADLGLVLLPGATTITAEASSPVDTMRGTA